MFFMIAVLALGLGGLGCEKMKEGRNTADVAESPLGLQAVQPSGGSLSVANVVVTPAQGEPVIFTVEVAKTPEEKSRGLMGRESLGEKHGMWFVFEEDVRDPFWMKDTPVSLDILFVDKNGKIVDIIADTVPNSTDMLKPGKEYRYALEVKAGTAAANRLAVGDKAELRLGPP